jgi:diguanylate cyclase (GGDEF)-like protein
VQHDDKTNAELVLLVKLFARIPAALTINLACGIGTIIIFWTEVPPSLLMSWSGLMAASLLFRLDGWRRFQRHKPTLLNAVRWRRLFIVGAAFTGLAWGSTAFFFYDPASIIARNFLPFVVAGMVGGSLVVLTGFMPAFCAFLLAAMGPFILRYSLIGDLAHNVMAALVVVYVIGLITLARAMSQSMIASIHLASVNEQLISQLREKSSQLQATFDHVNQGVAVFDHLGRLLTWNPRHRELHGYPIHLYRPGTHIRQFLDQDLSRSDHLAGGELDPKALAEPLAPTEFQQTSPDGRALAVERSAMPGGGFVSTSTDITDHKRVEARMLHLAQHDPLTDLPNRLLFQDRLQQAMARSTRSGSPVGVIVIDLDGFKAINDREGHRVGDEVLKALARRLSTGLRDTDTVARIGGDEFALVLPDLTSAAAAIRIGEKVLARVDTPLKVEDHYVDLKASFGVAIYPADARDAETLLQYADLAMYQAKHAGGGIRLAKATADRHRRMAAIKTRASSAVG